MPRTSRAARFHPSVEFLEHRCVPATITPTTFADGGLGSGSLRDAVLQFNADTGTADDTIQLLPGTYSLTIRNVNGRHETAGLSGDLNLTQTSHRWIIQGAGPSTIIDASQLQDRVFQIVNPGTHVVFQDLVIQGGLAQDNGADGALAGSTDALGGGILNNGGNLTLDNVVVQNNVARGGMNFDGYNARGGGLFSTGGSATISDSTIANNQAVGGDGRDGYPYAGNGGDGTGGGIYAVGGPLNLTNTAISGSAARGGQGGSYGTCSSICSGGHDGRGQGGGIYASGGLLTLTTLSGNSSGYGAGIYNQGTLIVSNCILSANVAAFASYSDGGGIYNSGTLTVTDCILSANVAAFAPYGGHGGGIYNSGTLTVSNSTLSGNSVGYSYSYGGGIYNSGTLTVSNSTLSGNNANCNQCTGGGIYTMDANPVTITNVTLTANRATIGGGLSVRPFFTAVPVLHNTLIAGNFRGATGTTPDDVNGRLDPSGDYNLIGDGTGMTGLQNGIIDIGAFEYQGDGSRPAPNLSRDTPGTLGELISVTTSNREHRAFSSLAISSTAAPRQMEPNRVADDASSVPNASSVDRIFASLYKKEPWQPGVWCDDLEPFDVIRLIVS